ncbi:MAG TPA: hypothetical protein VK892_07190 [Pyrinomonadaceae bacterium]|nr:hypothetical protein [Pyrinomonadaceae bacterium]
MKKQDNLESETIAGLERRKKISREYLRSLSPSEKIAQLMVLQERCYKMLAAREKSGGRPIPERWRKWHKARYANSTD